MTNVWMDADGRISIDIGCAGCGYNLRSLPIVGVCPECGVPISDSRPLCVRSAAWLRRIRLGVAVLLLSLPLTVVVPAAFDEIVFRLFGPESSAWPQEVDETVEHNPPFPWTRRIAALVGMAPCAATLVAVLLITKRDENDATMSRLRSRSTARILASLGLFWLVGATAIQMADWNGFWWKFALIQEAVRECLYAAIALATMSYVTYLLRRSLRLRLARFGHLLWVILLPLVAAWFALCATSLITCALTPAPPELPYACVVSGSPPGATPQNAASAPMTATTSEYIIMDERLGMTRATTAPAFMLERYQAFVQAEQQTRQRRSFWVDVYGAIGTYTMIPGALWACCALLLLALLWRTFHRAVKQSLELG